MSVDPDTGEWERPIDRPRRLRRDATTPERILWSYLRRGHIGGLKFRRQHLIRPYVVDFFCHAAKLVVELDGETHIGTATTDEARSRFLERKGFRVIRFTNDDVLQHTEAVLVAIARAAGLDW